MFKKIHLILIISVHLTSCVGNSKYNENAHIKGVLLNSNNHKLVLQKLLSKDIVILDSARTSEDGKFSFSYVPDESGYYRVFASDNSFFNLILHPGEKVTITGDYTSLGSSYQVTGSEDSKRLKQFNDELMNIYKKNDSLNTVARNLQSGGNVQSLIDIQTQQQKLNTDYYQYVKSFISEKPSSLAALAAVQKLNIETDIEYFVMVDDGLKNIIPNSSLYKDFNALVSSNKKLAVGFTAPEIVLNDTEGKPFALSSLKGKIVLIDFWASWCGPCRKENPNVVRMYKKYNSKGFEILGVSLDNNKNAWLNAINQDGLTWKHVSDLGGWQSSIAPVYNINSIPMTYLVDKEGKIIGKNLRGAALEQKLEELFN